MKLIKDKKYKMVDLDGTSKTIICKNVNIIGYLIYIVEDEIEMRINDRLIKAMGITEL